MKIDGVTALALIVIASFAIDRIVTGMLFLLSYSKAWTRHFPEPALIEDEGRRARAEKRDKLIYFVFAGFLGIVVLAGCANVRILTAIGIQPSWASTTQSTQPKSTTATAQPDEAKTTVGSMLFATLDIVFTGLLLVAGADRIAQVIKMPGAPGVERPESKPIQITGTLTIENSGAKMSGTGKPNDMLST